MSISAVSSSSSNAYSSVNNDSELTRLKKQKIDLEKELQTVQQSEEEEETKEEKIKLLQMQIQQIEAQMQNISNNRNTGSSQETGDKKGPEQFLTDAAKVLGLSSDELKTQLQSGGDLQSIIEEQNMTVEEFQQEMSELRQTNDSQNPPPPPPPEKASEQFYTDAAEVLGLSSDELKTQLQSGKNFRSIIEEQDLTLEDFQKEMTSLFNSRHSADVDQVGNIFDKTV